MTRDEIYCYIMTNIELYGKRKFTQKEIATNLGVSVGSVFYALEPLVRSGAVIKRPRGFIVVEPKKLLMIWATYHKQEVQYSTFYPARIDEIEAMMPNGLFTAYSGARLYYNINPSNYSEVYIYADCDEVRRRFPPRKGPHNIYCLKPLKCLQVLNITRTPLTLIYVDIFNNPNWYSSEFLKELEAVLHGVLE